MVKEKPQARRGGGKKKKVSVVFDEAARQEFLTGFHKRKLMKKAFYKTKLDKKMSEEKQRIRSQARNLGRSSSHAILPEVEALLAAENPSISNIESYDIGSKTVTITSLDSIHQSVVPEPEESDEGEPELPLESTDNKEPLNSKQFVSRTLQNSAIFKKVQRLKQKSKKSRPKKNPYYTNPKEKAEGTGNKGTKNKLIKSRKGKGKPQKSKKKGKKR